MAIQTKYEIQEIAELLSHTHLFEQWARLLTWSGRYVYSSIKKTIAKEADIFRRAVDVQRIVRNPGYRLERPILQQPDSVFERLKPALRICLHIDIDSTHPLDAVSGTVHKTSYWMFNLPRHFVGQVTSNTATAGGRSLVVENFELTWPGSGKEIGRIDIELSEIANPKAVVVFIATDGTEYGPYTIPRKSRYFREVEFEIDREDGAEEIEPYNTHTHPDRPEGLAEQNLTIASAYAKAGIKVTRSSNENVITTPGNTSPGGNDWTTPELHDAMEDHWESFENKAQWKLWFLAAENHTNAGLGGIMFDSTTPEAGDVTRQGAAIFTHQNTAFGTTGDLPTQNPPESEAIARELFVVSVHEIGHAFNLLHSWRKTAYNEWPRPAWADQPTDDDQAPSWMNYSFRADEDPVNTKSAQAFYNDFEFRFIDEENFFLRHAPEKYVQMGNETWLSNHGYGIEGRIDPRLSLAIRTNREALELGEAAFVELRLRNVSRQSVNVVEYLDPAAGNVDIAITDPDGNRIPFLPPVHADHFSMPTELKPGGSIYASVQLTVGKLGGFHFKKPGAYRIEAAYTNFDGKQAAAVHQIWVKPSPSHAALRAVNDLFTGRVARVLYFGGSRVMEDVNDRLEFVRNRLDPGHPAHIHIANCLALPFARRWKRIDRAANKRIELDEDPGRVVNLLQPMMKTLDLAADSLGHIQTRKIVDAYTNSAMKSRKKAAALKVQREMISLFTKRGVPPSFIKEMNAKLRQMK
jgi:hypothetical protein